MLPNWTTSDRHAARGPSGRLLKNAEVQAEIRVGIERSSKAVAITTDQVFGATAERVKGAARVTIKDYFDEHGNLLPPHMLSDQAARQVVSFEVIKKNLVSGDGMIDEIHKYKLSNDALGWPGQRRRPARPGRTGLRRPLGFPSSRVQSPRGGV